MTALQPMKRKRSVNDFSLCIICQEASEEPFTIKPEHKSYEKVITFSRERVEYGDIQYADLVDRLSEMSAKELAKKSAFYHRNCYQTLTMSNMLERAKVRYEKALMQGSVTLARKSLGRPSSEQEPMESTSDERVHRSSVSPHSRQLCIFCQEESDHYLHEITTCSMGEKVKIAVEGSYDNELKVRLGGLLNEPSDAIAYDMKYHLPCWIKVQRKSAETLKKGIEPETDNSIGKIISDLEILNIVEIVLKDPSAVLLDMNIVNTTCLNLLDENDVATQPSDNYKRHLKGLILDNLVDVEVVKSKRRNEPEKICSKTTLGTSIDIAAGKDDTTEMKLLMKAASILRTEIAGGGKWTFKGSFNEYDVPQKLYTFMKWVIEGPKSTVQTERKQIIINKSASNLAQHLVTAYKSERQVHYVSPSADGKFKPIGETPFSLGLSVLLHQQTRKKSLVQVASRLGIGENYARVLSLETQLANAVIERMKEFNGLYIPSFVVKGHPVYFAIDNVDFLEDTSTGKDTLHGTAIVMYQKEVKTENPMVSPLHLEGGRNAQMLREPVQLHLLPCQPPKLKFHLKPGFNIKVYHGVSEIYRVWDMAWIMASCIGPVTKDTIEEEGDNQHASSSLKDSDSELSEDDLSERLNPGKAQEVYGGGLSKSLPTWAAYNSLTTKAGTKTNVAVIPPLLRHSPTTWPGLYTALMRAQHISVTVVGEDRPTVITLDLQLYEKAQKLMSRDDMRGKFVIRIGELHTIFSSLKAIGRYIEGSGIDELWVEAGMYSPTTVRQIIEGKHLYRAMEAHMVTLLTLYSLLFPLLWESGVEGKTVVEDAASEVNSKVKNVSNTSELQKVHVHMIAAIEQIDFLRNLDNFDKQCKGIQTFLRNYMRQFECILRHIRASRQGEWCLHLAAQEELCKYFFAHDHLSYAKFSILYCAEMQKLKETDPQTWKALEDGDFCVTKSSIPFCSIGPDHGIEHENRTMKVLGGITGITQNEAALDKFFLIAPELARLVQEFGQLNEINLKEQRKQHHDLIGAVRNRVFLNAQIMKDAILCHGNPFTDNSDEVINLLTKAVMTDDVQDNVIRRDELGQAAVVSFISERIVKQETSFWEPMKKMSLRLFRNSSKPLKTKIGEKVIELREERNLLARFLIIMRSRPEINMKEAIGHYEFSAVPRSLFSPDGEILLAYDKANILHALEDLPKPKSQVLEEEPRIQESHQLESEMDTPSDNSEESVGEQNNAKVLIIDGMALVNAIQKTGVMKTCKDFAHAFIEKLVLESANYSEVRLIFDRYMTGSLKEKTRDKRTAGKHIKYHVSDNTNIANIQLRQFLSHIDTKDELTIYLSDKALCHFNDQDQIKFVVVYGTEAHSNFEDFTEELKTHSHEEADTLIVLHAVDVSRCNRNVELHIFSPDTDVFLLLINRYSQLCPNTTFITGRGPARRHIHIKDVFERLGQNKAASILGFHAFTGADTSGRFAGKTKKTCFKTFMTSDTDILSAFECLGKGEDKPSEDTFKALERFVCKLYCSKGSDISRIPDCRWFLFSQKHAEGEKLPPTVGTLRQHVYRAHYITMIWVKADEPHPLIPPPTDYGWVLEDSRLVPIMSKDLPAPKSILMLVKCSCKTDCSSGRCSCIQADMKCTEFCGCSDACQNSSDQICLSDDVTGIDDDDSDESETEDY